MKQFEIEVLRLWYVDRDSQSEHNMIKCQAFVCFQRGKIVASGTTGVSFTETAPIPRKLAFEEAVTKFTNVSLQEEGKP